MNTNSKEIIKSEIKQLLNLDNSNISPLEVVKKMLFSTSPEKLNSLSQYKKQAKNKKKEERKNRKQKKKNITIKKTNK
jgi:hypothetical protein